MEINIKQIPNGKWKENCYVVSNINRDSLIIDPGSDMESITSYIEKYNLKVKIIINTHGHYDHIGAVAALKDKYSIPFCLHSKDQKLVNSANLYLKIFDGEGPIAIPEVDYYYEEINIQDYISFFSTKVIFTPGHTFGSVCLLIENNLFTGDTLFRRHIGRTDLPGGDKELLHKSLNCISKLETNISIYPGHGSSSNIGDALKNNAAFINVLK
jgi:hydroxyacylglutathione hydrolase